MSLRSRAPWEFQRSGGTRGPSRDVEAPWVVAELTDVDMLVGSREVRREANADPAETSRLP
eukprot:8782661-Pyramimonas_sp.AAC.1